MTTKVTPLITQDMILDQATSWLSELDRGLSKDREQELRVWLLQSVKHKDAFLEMAALWDDLSVLSQLSDIFPYKDKEPKQKWLSSSAFYKLAATVVLCLFIELYYPNSETKILADQATEQSGSELLAIYRTKIGEYQEIQLPDNSKLRINTNSEVRVEYSNDQRTVLLEYGEVHIDVAHDKSRKFIVTAGGKSIEAIGTAFNVQHYNNVSIELVVTEGTVVVSNALQQASSKILETLQNLETDTPENQTIAITAGQQIVMNRHESVQEETIHIENITDEIETRLAWMEGSLVFKGESMNQAIEEISRYSPWKFELRGDDIKAIRVIGRFQTGDIDQLLETLSKNFNINAERVEHSKIILTIAKVSG
ncbi:FecR family protein [Colwelliaceae bacterium 6441]